MNSNEHAALNFCRKRREQLQKNIKALQSGSFKHLEMRNGEFVNVTASVLAQMKAELTEVKTLIADNG